MKGPCPKCGLDHDNPGSELNAVKVLACVMPEYTFYTRYGKVKRPGKKAVFKRGHAIEQP